MNFLLAALLFFLTWWFADQGLYFFSMLFIIVLVMVAIAEGNKPPTTKVMMQVNAHPAASPAIAPHPEWNDDRIEKFGRGLANVILVPLKILWKLLNYAWGNRK
jgi:hypothetical protein